MSKKAYEFAVVLRITADSYYEALITAKNITDFVADDVDASDEGVEARLETEFERDDENQRVLYLHNEECPIIVE